jgi:Stage II sporulation protein E (SpoIIE)
VEVVEPMRESRSLLAWGLAGIVAVPVVLWALPRAFPLFPPHWTTSKREAKAISLARVRELGEVPAGAYVVTRLRVDPQLERQVQLRLAGDAAERIPGSRPAREIVVWETSIYKPGARSADWTYRVLITPDGEVTGVVAKAPPEEKAGSLDPAVARQRADALLRAHGYDLSRFTEPEVRSQQLESRTDLTLRYRDREELLGADSPYGFAVTFAGDRLTGYDSFYDAPKDRHDGGLQLLVLLNQAWVFLPIVLLPLVAIPFLRRYHAGEIGVRRGLEILALVLGSAAVVLVTTAAGAAGDWNFGVLTRQQTTVVVALQLFMVFFFPLGLLAFLSWSVGESLCRERWGEKLAAFDALFKLDWNNATFARAALRGLVALLAALWALAAGAGHLGARASLFTLFGGWWASASWFALPLVGMTVAYGLCQELFGRLLLVSAGVRLLGRWGGAALAVVAGALVFIPPLSVDPLPMSLPFWLLASGALVLLFLRYGLATSVIASLTLSVAASAVPMLTVADASLQLQAALALLIVALPLIVSLRHLGSAREFTYRYEDIPPHVRRIAERERQRVELETARRIQSSILPELPPMLNGVEIAHAYLPASEVGGDFYDVLALEDGRLAVAVGDVAGHGVSSGLVMSMARSALAVQVTFDPEIAAVFGTLNRMVFQTARKRLLATLCYALLDPKRGELLYGSAGHLFPYKIDRAGSVEALESVAYPLGVRSQIDVAERTARVGSGDILFLFSDGVVEARRDGGDEQFGFVRLEESLGRYARRGVRGLCDGVLADVDAFTGHAPREDDQTIVVLRLP